MPTKRPANEQVKHRYFHYLEHADGKSVKTISQVVTRIGRYESFTKHEDFRAFDQKRAVEFKQHMQKTSLAPGTIHSTLKTVKRFFSWLAMQPGYKSRIRMNDVDYLNLSDKAVRAATAARDKPYPTLAMVEAAVRAMPHDTVIEKRNRALMAFGALTAIRAGAVISLKGKHFDKGRMLVIQQPDEVETKFSKRIDTFLMPISDYIEGVFLDWVRYREAELLFGPSDPLFPRTQLGHDHNRQFTPIGLSRIHWKTADSLREIYEHAFEMAGLPTYTPHCFRDMLVSEMYKRNLTVAEVKAWSQNLGHESVLTTLTSYGKLSLYEQGDLIRPTKDGKTR